METSREDQPPTHIPRDPIIVNKLEKSIYNIWD